MPELGSIYLVDDDDGVRASMSFLLRSLGLSARLFNSASSFLEVSDDLPPGCLITDLRMPGMDGLELLSRLRKAGAQHRVVVVTGHGDVALSADVMNAGARAYLEKPFEDTALVAAVEACLAELAAQAANENARR